MAYNVAANMQFAKPVSAFIDARDNVTRNALAERQVANVEQNTAFQQQRLSATDQIEAHRRQQEQDAEEGKQLFTAMSYLNNVANNPEQFSATAQQMFASPKLAPIFQKHQVLPEDVTPQNVQKLLAASGAQVGEGPVVNKTPQINIQKGPKGSDIVTYGDTMRVLEQPQANQGDNASWSIITRPVGGGLVQDFDFNPKTRQRVPNGQPYKPVTTMTGNVTEGERKAAALATRLDASLQKLQAVTAGNEASQKPGVLERGFENIGMETAANIARSPARQRVNAAQLDALDAALTLATGAAYTKEQLESLRTSYFPQMGDDETTVKDKRDRFALIVETARIAAGRAEPSVDKALATRPDAQQPAPAGSDIAAAAAAELARRRGQRGP